MNRFLAVAVLIATTAAGPAHAAAAYRISDVYVAGVSSGGYLAEHLHLAHSARVHGAAIFAAGPYDCAQGQLTTALLACMDDRVDDQPARLAQLARDRAAHGQLDPLANVSGDPVWLYHGTADTTVKASVTNDLAALYRDLGASVVYDNTGPAGHAWVTPLGPNPCATTAPPYLNNCGTDPQRAFLTHLLGPVQSPAATPGGELRRIDQNAYAPGGSASAISMDNTGLLYVPTSCAAGAPCRLLVTLHGCHQGFDALGTQFADRSYLDHYADTNNLMILYPQAKTTYWPTYNPNGCWDWWGYTGTTYATRDGAQIRTIMRMVDALGAP